MAKRCDDRMNRLRKMKRKQIKCEIWEKLCNLGEGKKVSRNKQIEQR